MSSDDKSALNGSAEHAAAVASNPELDAKVSKMLDSLEELLEQEDLDGAVGLCHDILELAPNNVEARVYLADIAYEDGDFTSVLELGQEVLKLDEHNDEMRLMMAEAYLADDQLEEALELCDELLRRNPNNLEARFTLAEVLLEMGGAKEAAELYESIVDEQPDNAAALLGLGVALYETCEFELSLQALEEALESDMELADAYFHIGLINERKGNAAAAEKAFKRARAIDPEAYPPPFKISPRDFDKVLAEVRKSMPARLRDALQKVTFTVEDLPAEQELKAHEPVLSPNVWGLFRGVPSAEAAGDDILARLPSEIVLFRSNLTRGVADKGELMDELRVTLLHEIGHLLGLEEDGEEEDEN